MNTPTQISDSPHQVRTAAILREIGIPIHRIGYRQLCFALPYCAERDVQVLSKELYPCIARQMGLSDWRAAEHAIREVIGYAWEHRDPAVWGTYFPNEDKAPSNKIFIATLVEKIR